MHSFTNSEKKLGLHVEESCLGIARGATEMQNFLHLYETFLIVGSSQGLKDKYEQPSKFHQTQLGGSRRIVVRGYTLHNAEEFEKTEIWWKMSGAKKSSGKQRVEKTSIKRKSKRALWWRVKTMIETKQRMKFRATSTKGSSDMPSRRAQNSIELRTLCTE